MRVKILIFAIFILSCSFVSAINYNIPSNYSTIEACFDAINNTNNSCILTEDNYAETFSIADKYYNFSNSEITLQFSNMKNISLDFNGADIVKEETISNKFIYCTNSTAVLNNLNFTSEGGYGVVIDNGGKLTVENSTLASKKGSTLGYDVNGFFRNDFFKTTMYGIEHYGTDLFIDNSTFEATGEYSILRGENGKTTINNSFFNNSVRTYLTEGSDLIIENTKFWNYNSNNQLEIVNIENVYLNNVSFVNASPSNCFVSYHSSYVEVRNSSFEQCGSTSEATYYKIANSVYSYNGNNFDQSTPTIFTADFSNSITIDQNDTDVSSIASGSNNFSLWLMDLSSIGYPFWTIYVEQPNSMSCADAAAYYGGTCYIDEQDFLQANGYRNNYTIKPVENLEIIGGNNPMFLNFYNVTNYDASAIFFSDGVLNVNVTSNIFSGNSTSPPIKTYDDITTGYAWLNHFYTLSPHKSSLDNLNIQFCNNGEGNFYKEGLTPAEGDCGQANITVPEENQEKNNTFNIIWKKQSSIFQVFYEVFIRKIGQSFLSLVTTTDTNYSLNTQEYNDTNYTIKIVPYVNGSRVNATPVYRKFVINNIPKIPTPTSPENGAVITDRKPIFKWNKSSNEEGIVYYNLLVDNDSDFSSNIINITTTSLNYTPDSDLFFSDYFWKVSANDTIYVSNFSNVTNFTLIKNIACFLPINSFNFSNISVGEVKNTTASQEAITIENSGNLKLNVSINASSLWEYFPNPTIYYMYLIRENETGAFERGLNNSWNNFSSEKKLSIVGLNYYDTNDTARIDIQIEAPNGEGGGSKSSTIWVWCEEDE